jgi:hypothetical protein
MRAAVLSAAAAAALAALPAAAAAQQFDRYRVDPVLDCGIRSLCLNFTCVRGGCVK